MALTTPLPISAYPEPIPRPALPQRYNSYTGFKLFVDRALAKEFYERCYQLGFCFNNGSLQESKLQYGSDSCWAYIFWNGDSYNPYLGTSADYNDSPKYYEGYVEYHTTLHQFMVCTRFRNSRYNGRSRYTNNSRMIIELLLRGGVKN